jgi:glycosyltransferase involved in cell wall biosynthesis
MRIGVDIRSLLEPYPSGVAYYLKNLLDQLLKIDRKNSYFLFYNSYRTRNLKLLEKFAKYQNVEIKGFNYPNKIFNCTLFFLHWPKIDHLLKGLDVFFAPNLQFLSLSKKCKKIVTVHDLSFELYPQFLSLKRKIWHRIINPKKFITSADKIIAVSQNTKNDLVRLYGIDSQKITVVYSGVNIQETSSLSLELPDKYILTVSTLEPRKNLEGLIAAFQELIKKEQFKDYHLLIVGPQGWKAEHLYHLAPGNKQIKFLGFVSDAEKSQLFQQAKVFVYPSFYEGFGFPPLEAIAHGAPVIVSMNSSLPEILGQAALYIDPYNIFEITRALEEVLTNEKLRQELITVGKQQAQKFSWEKSAQETLRIFNFKI